MESTIPKKQGFDPKKCLALISAFPIGHCAPQLINWLRDIGISGKNIIVHWSARRDLICEYNHGIKMAIESNAPWLIFLDNDMKPQVATAQPFLELDADLSCIQYQTELPHTNAWGMDCAFHCGMWKCNRDTLLKLEKPSFRYSPMEDGCSLQGCVCVDFAERAMQMGLTISHGGYAEHTPRKRV